MTEQTGDCGSSVSNPPKVSSAYLTVSADSQVMKQLFYTIYKLGLQSISDPIYFNTFFKSRAAPMKLKVPLLPEILTKVNGITNVHPVSLSPSSLMLLHPHHILKPINCMKT